MPDVILYIAAVLLALFVLSGVIPAYRRASSRARRAAEFKNNYEAWANGDDSLREWLTARRTQMQHDAQAVGHGVTYVAPPPAIGGGSYMAHQMFADLFNNQSYTDNVTAQVRIETLTTTVHDLEHIKARRRKELWNPAAWAQRLFERVIRLPRYLLTQAGFSEQTVESRGARVVTVLWSLIVGVATIGAFVVGLIQLLSQ